MSLQLQILQPDGFAEASALSSRAMRKTESWLEIYRGEEDWRVPELQFLFEGFMLLKFRSDPRSIRVGRDENGKIVCSFIFANSTSPELSIWEKIRAGILHVPFRAGFAVFQRLLKTDEWHSSLCKSYIGDRQHFLVNVMAVEPSEQGKGWGSKFLTQALQEADSLGIPVLLGTNSEINVRFYTKL
jgi:hypothetical protein